MATGSEFTTWESYFWPGTEVLRNLAGIRSAPALSQFELDASTARAASLNPAPGVPLFGLQHLQAIHKHLFQDVYPWAGELRQVNIAKGGSHFARSERIESYGTLLAARLAQENHLRGLPKAQFVARLAHHYSEWNALHPFREGNGRATRAFLGQLCNQAGYEMDLTRLGTLSAQQWSLAAAASFNGRMGPMQSVLDTAIRPLIAHAFEHLDPVAARTQHPELIPVYLKLEALEKELQDRYGVSAQHTQNTLDKVRQVILHCLDNGQRVAQVMSPGPGSSPPSPTDSTAQPAAAAHRPRL